jgi:hypothetical protein
MAISIDKSATPDGAMEVWVMTDPDHSLSELPLHVRALEVLPESGFTITVPESPDPGTCVALVKVAPEGPRDIEISMSLKSRLAEVKSSRMMVTEGELETLLALSRGFFAEEAGFEVWTDDGFTVVPPEVTKQSILSISITRPNEDGVQDV